MYLTFTYPTYLLLNLHTWRSHCFLLSPAYIIYLPGALLNLLIWYLRISLIWRSIYLLYVVFIYFIYLIFISVTYVTCRSLTLHDAHLSCLILSPYLPGTFLPGIHLHFLTGTNLLTWYPHTLHIWRSHFFTWLSLTLRSLA